MQLFAMAWSPDGKQLATIGRDHVIRIYDPRNSTSPVNEGAGPEGSRGAHITWLSNTHLVVTGFDKLASNSLYIYLVNINLFSIVITLQVYVHYI